MDRYALSDSAILQRIGEKIKEVRVEQRVTQKQLSAAAGVSAFAISTIENGHNTSLLTLTQVLRALNRLELLDPFFQEPQISPIAYAKMVEERKKRIRVTSKRKPIEKEEQW